MKWEDRSRKARLKGTKGYYCLNFIYGVTFRPIKFPQFLRNFPHLHFAANNFWPQPTAKLIFFDPVIAS